MNHNILNNIRKNNLITAIACGMLGILPTIGFFHYLLNDGIEAWVALALFGFLGGLMDWLCIKCLILVVDPNKSNIFQKYGSLENLEKIMNEIENTIIYEDNQIIISKNYVADKKDYEKILAFKDILRVHKLVHKTNFVIDSYSVVITDKYNFEISYKYPVKDLEKVEKLIIMIGNMSQNAKIGYSKENQQYVNNNKVELPKKENYTEVKLNKKIYQCPDCNKEIEFGDKFCKECGCKIDWN